MKRSRKACAFVARPGSYGPPALLVFSFGDRPHLPRRLPGGSIAQGESPLAAAQREAAEETGLEGLVVLRKLGVRHYYKAYTKADVERHDYLLHAPENIPDAFSHIVTGGGGDAGERFDCRWLVAEDFASIDPEFGEHLTPEYLPELFVRSREPSIAGDSERVRIVAYDPEWQRRFDDQRTLLQEIFGTGALIAHVGSTAVPGLGAKPIVDIMVGLTSLDEAATLTRQLAGIGYERKTEGETDSARRLYFRQRRNGQRFVHLHCVVTGSVEWTETVAFRDRLRGDAALASEYLALKRRLAETHGADRIAYTSAKGPFIEAALGKAGVSEP